MSGSVRAKQRICTNLLNLPTPRDFSCAKYQNPSLSQTLNIFPETNHYFLLRNSFLLLLLLLGVVVVVVLYLCVCLFVHLLFWPMLLSGQMSDMRRFNGSNECRACRIVAHVLLRGKTLIFERNFYRFTA